MRRNGGAAEWSRAAKRGWGGDESDDRYWGDLNGKVETWRGVTDETGYAGTGGLECAQRDEVPRRVLAGLQAASIVDEGDPTRVLERCRDMATVRLEDVLAVYQARD